MTHQQTRAVAAAQHSRRAMPLLLVLTSWVMQQARQLTKQQGG
jgi:hypothetical protein